jgi:protocatechuate 3,4-dioxygenase beta subunit
MTDSGGAYRIAAIDGPSVLIAMAPAHEQQVRELLPASDQQHLDFVLNLARPSSVSGTVVDAAGGAVPGALVLAHRPGPSGAVAATWSDDSGRFALALDPGAATLEAQAEAYASAQLEVEVPAGALQLVLAVTSTLSGVVVSEATNEPVPGVSVSAFAQSVVPGSVRPALADAAGRFQLTGLHAGTYRLHAAGPQWAGGDVTATLGLAEVSDAMVLKVRPAATLSGVIRARGEPCRAGSVLLTGEVAFGASADAQGEVSIEGVVSGSYDVMVMCPGSVSSHERLEIDAPVHRQWDLGAGVTVHGRVERASGKPFAGIAVRMTAAAPPGASPALDVPVECVASADAEFACSGLHTGKYQIHLGSPAPIEAGSIVIRAQEPDPPAVVLRMPPVASIAIDVGGSTRPSTFHVLARTSSGPPLRAEPRAEGYLLHDIPLGTYTVYYGPTSRLSATAPSVVLSADAEVAHVTLAAATTLEISGQVLDASGSAVAELWVQAQSADADVSAEVAGAPALTDERGEFVLQGLIPGTYDIMAGAEQRALLTSASAGSRGLVLQLLD